MTHKIDAEIVPGCCRGCTSVLCIQLKFTKNFCVYNIQIYLKVLHMLVRQPEGKRGSRERGRDRDRRDTSSTSSDWSERDLTLITSSLPPQTPSFPLPPASSAHTAPTLTIQDYPATQTLKLPSGSLNRMSTIRQTEGVRSTFRVADRL